jgi:hypothetical protein
MAVEPTKLIAALSPDAYCRKDKQKEVKEIAKQAILKKENDAYLKAAEVAELADSEFLDLDEVIKTPFKLVGLKNPIEQHSAAYDTSSQALEQVYYWLHDYLQNTKVDYGIVEKIVDNFLSAPGSAHFSEMGMRVTKMQEEGMKILGVANQLIKSILNIIYDLKEFKLRLEIYDDYHNEKDKNKRESAYLSLKQIWLDQVDIKRGTSSIKALAVSGANAPNFVMLIDAFMVAKSLEEIKKMDLNERVQRLLEQRFGEFRRWLELSEKELRKRYEIEKIYLKSQLNTIKLYSRWAKPYLKAAAQLEQRATATSSLVSAFSTSLFELTLLGIGEYDPVKDVKKGELPKVFKDKNKRKYAPVVLVELKFRSIPERFQQGGYGFRGKADITFTSFALNEEERKILKSQLDWDDFKDVYSLISGATEESLEQMQSDINEIFGEGIKEEAKKESSEETNPFAALLSIITDIFKKKEGKKEEKKGEKKLEIAPDSEIEKVMRSQAGLEARRRCRKFYDSFKKANNSPAFPAF